MDSTSGMFLSGYDMGGSNVAYENTFGDLNNFPGYDALMDDVLVSSNLFTDDDLSAVGAIASTPAAQAQGCGSVAPTETMNYPVALGGLVLPPAPPTTATATVPASEYGNLFGNATLGYTSSQPPSASTQDWSSAFTTPDLPPLFDFEGGAPMSRDNSLQSTASSNAASFSGAASGVAPSTGLVVVHEGGYSTTRPRSRHSASGGVRPTRANRPLQPIIADASDDKAMKRARNTAAARKSRQRKADEVEELKAIIARQAQVIESQAEEIRKLRAELAAYRGQA